MWSSYRVPRSVSTTSSQFATNWDMGCGCTLTLRRLLRFLLSAANEKVEASPRWFFSQPPPPPSAKVAIASRPASGAATFVSYVVAIVRTPLAVAFSRIRRMASYSSEILSRRRTSSAPVQSVKFLLLETRCESWPRFLSAIDATTRSGFSRVRNTRPTSYSACDGSERTSAHARGSRNRSSSSPSPLPWPSKQIKKPAAACCAIHSRHHRGFRPVAHARSFGVAEYAVEQSQSMRS
mmetsp:Transcript_4866/g.14747  ORF Transcript_4866/g.14747 Transcript_4866/m.14747 type:complete len:237 (-) Transcript_4866:159-869(-)